MTDWPAIMTLSASGHVLRPTKVHWNSDAIIAITRRGGGEGGIQEIIHVEYKLISGFSE